MNIILRHGENDMDTPGNTDVFEREVPETAVAIIVDDVPILPQINPLVVLRAEKVAEIEKWVTESARLTTIDIDNKPEAETCYAMLMSLEKTLESERVGAKAPFLAIGKAIDAAVKNCASALAGARKSLGDQILRFNQEQERLRQKAFEEAQRQQRERERIIEENRRNEQKRIQEAEEKGRPVEVTLDPLPPPPPAPVPVEVPKSSVIKKVKKYTLMILDLDKVPDTILDPEFGLQNLWILDESRCLASMKRGVKIPGLNLKVEEVSAGR